MSEEQIQGVEATEAVAPEVPKTVGDCLREAREAAGMSIVEVAQSLRLSRKQIELLENDAWSQLPGMTSVRGFVRNYARLLDLDATPIMAKLEGVVAGSAASISLELPTPATNVTLPQAGAPQRKDVFAVVSGLLFVLLAVVAYFFMPDDFMSYFKSAPKEDVVAAKPAEGSENIQQGMGPQVLQAPSAPAEPILPPASQPPVNAPEAPPAAAPGVLTTPPAPSPATTGQNAAPVVLSTPPAAAPVVAGPIKLSFAGSSWVEVKGKEGKILFSQSNSAGSEKDVAGEGPYNLVIGNAAQVKLSFKGKPVDLEPHTKGAVARLTLE